MFMEQTLTYPPLNTLDLVSEGVWIVNGPAIRFGPPLLRMPFSTRMSVIKLAGGIFVHSPTLLVPSLKAEIDKIGAVKWIIAPNRLHYTWVQNWAEAFPAACVYLAPGIEKQARGRISVTLQGLRLSVGWRDRDTTNRQQLYD
jgi:hypothetical protein